MKTYFRLIAYARPLKHYLPLYIPFIILAILFQLLSFGFIIPILDVLFKKGSGENVKVITEPAQFELNMESISRWTEYWKYQLTVPRDGYDYQDLLTVICAFLITTVLLSNIFRFFAQRILGSVRSRMVKRMREAIYENVISKHVSFFSEQNRSDIVSRMTNDIQQVESLIVNSFQTFIREPFTIIIIFIILLMMNAKLTLIAILVLPISGAFISTITRKLKKKSTKSQDLLGHILGKLDESILGLKIIKAFNAEHYVSSSFRKVNESYAKTLKYMEHRKSLASPVSQFLGFSMVAIIIYIGGMQVLDPNDPNAMEGSDFMGYILTLAQMIAPVKGLSSGISSIQRGIVAGGRIFDVIDHEPKIKNPSNPTYLESFEKTIKVENVVFRYQSENVLRGINLEIKKGQTVALVGPSGGGKSTLIDMFPRFHDPVEGRITIDGYDLKDLEMQSLRHQMGIVTQEAILFNDSILNNISFGIEATREDVERAAKIANAYDFIMASENGFDTIIGDRGMNLSGGQRQRITIARAILKNPPILLLDEATSALDSESEHLVQEALNNLMQNRTTIVIAHRLSTIQNADKIVVIQQGEIVEEGTHGNLIAEQGLYAKLNEMQGH